MILFQPDANVLSWLKQYGGVPAYVPERWPGPKYGLICVHLHKDESSNYDVVATVVTTQEQMHSLLQYGKPRLWYKLTRAQIYENSCAKVEDFEVVPS